MDIKARLSQTWKQIELAALYAYSMVPAKFRADRRGAVNVGDVILMIVGFFMAGILMPIAIGYIFNATTTNWDPTVKTVFQVVFTIMAILAIALYFFYHMKD